MDLASVAAHDGQVERGVAVDVLLVDVGA